MPQTCIQRNKFYMNYLTIKNNASKIIIHGTYAHSLIDILVIFTVFLVHFF